jgi:hypothetical protein
LFQVSLLVIGPTTITPAIPTDVSKWIFLACIMVSFGLLIWDSVKAYRILKRREIAYIFTSVTAHRYLSVIDYHYYCLFRSINAKTQGIENYAFFIYFTLKNWKRLLLAEAPRQVINVVTLQALVPKWIQIRNGSVTFDNDALGSGTLQKVLTGTMAFSVLVFTISFISVIIAAILYIPLLCHIRGNLKEYCCHKIDKRIARLLQRQNYRRPQRPSMTNETIHSNVPLNYKNGNHGYHQIIQYGQSIPVYEKTSKKQYHGYMPLEHNEDIMYQSQHYNAAVNDLQSQYNNHFNPSYTVYNQNSYPYY